MQNEPDYSEIFPVGAKVVCESEMWQGKWEEGVVIAHLRSRYNQRMGIRILTPTALVDYDYRYLDINPHLSLVRLDKGR